MTQDCKNTHILYIQGLYATLSNTYLNKLKIGKVCKEAELHLDITREYLDSLCSYQVFDDTVTYAYNFTITREGEDTVDINITINMESFTYSGDGDLEEILAYFKAQIEANVTYDFEVYIDDDILYVWSYDAGMAFSDTTTVSTSDSDEATIEAENMENTYCEILDFINCLTTEEICKLIEHSHQILKNCNC